MSDRCRYCQGPVAPAALDVALFDDRRIAHLACYERAEARPQPCPAAPTPAEGDTTACEAPALDGEAEP
jgi:hypothetical protein